MNLEKVTFGVFTDLHLDIMHDGEWRFGQFMEAACREQVDFIIQLGDFCYPENTDFCACSPEHMPVNLKNAVNRVIDVPKMQLLHSFNSFEKPSYHVLGNHEFDFCSKAQAMSLYGMKSRYYSFCCKGWRFLVLDGNNFRDREGGMKDYWYGDYFDSSDLPYLDEEQMAWLEEELARDTGPAVLFSHQPLLAGPRGIRNAAALRTLFEKTGNHGKRIRLCLNGHTHVDELVKENGVLYYTVNSMSNHWVGEEYECRRYGKEIETGFPNLKYTLPYETPLYSIVTLDRTGLSIKGRQGRFVEPGPGRLGIGKGVSASIADRRVRWNVQEAQGGRIYLNCQTKAFVK